ncbi:hypothetical protein SGPA1_12616 [Streptomyces misionensis JCM 4497]
MPLSDQEPEPRHDRLPAPAERRRPDGGRTGTARADPGRLARTGTRGRAVGVAVPGRDRPAVLSGRADPRRRGRLPHRARSCVRSRAARRHGRLRPLRGPGVGRPAHRGAGRRGRLDDRDARPGTGRGPPQPGPGPGPTAGAGAGAAGRAAGRARPDAGPGGRVPGRLVDAGPPPAAGGDHRGAAPAHRPSAGRRPHP